MNKQKNQGSLTVVKNELPDEYADRANRLKEVLRGSKLKNNCMREVELLLRDNGADYFKIEIDNGDVNVQDYGQYDLIWKYHGLGTDFIVYVDFD